MFYTWQIIFMHSRQLDGIRFRAIVNLDVMNYN